MLNLLYNSPEYREVPLRERQRAAHAARQKVMRHWQFWCALGGMILMTLSFSRIARWLGDQPNGTIGAGCGFLLGMFWYSRVLNRIGMPYYREILSEYLRRQG